MRGGSARTRSSGRPTCSPEWTRTGLRGWVEPDYGLSRPAHPRSSCSSHHDTFGRQESELATRLDNLPATFVHQPRVVVAEQDFVGHISRSATRPGNDVIWSRPVDRPVAAGGPAAFISDPKRPPPRSRVDSSRAADVDNHRVREQDA